MKCLKITGIVFLTFVLVAGVCLFVTPVRNEIIYFYYYQTGNYSNEQKAAMRDTRSGKPVNYSIEANGKTYTVPLPNGATKYPDGGYLVINYEFWGDYFNSLKSLEGYAWDQMATTVYLNSDDGKIKIFIDFQNIARRYECFHIKYWLTDGS